MKNIQKIAEEIFQAPAKEELFERMTEYGTFMSPSYDLGRVWFGFNVISKKEEDVLKQTFPHGAFYISFYASHFCELDNLIKKYRKNFRLLVRNKEKRNDWYIMKVFDRTVVVSYHDAEQKSYFIEPKT